MFKTAGRAGCGVGFRQCRFTDDHAACPHRAAALIPAWLQAEKP